MDLPVIPSCQTKKSHFCYEGCTNSRINVIRANTNTAEKRCKSSPVSGEPVWVCQSWKYEDNIIFLKNAIETLNRVIVAGCLPVMLEKDVQDVCFALLTVASNLKEAAAIQEVWLSLEESWLSL